jgi:drug/metabolite transporter (DMT)-like permease
VRGVTWAIVCAGFIAGDHLCYTCALSTGAKPSAVFASGLVVALPASVASLGWSGWAAAALRASPAVVAVAGLLCTASLLAFLSALALGGAGAAVTLRNTSVLFALLLAWGIGERPGRRQVAGTVGVAAVAGKSMEWRESSRRRGARRAPMVGQP